jgi:hypothetical protein
MLDLARDVLDKQLLDRESRPFGKVDGIVLELRGDRPPRVVALEVGAATRLARLPGWLARWVCPLARSADSTRIPKDAVLAVAKDIRVDIDATQTPAWRVERWLAERVLARLPGGR